MENNTELLILKTARKHFVQNGFVATRMQDIADEAGINKALLHYYFRSKNKLYQQILESILDEVMPKLAKALEHDGSFWERMDKIVHAYIEMLLEQPDIPFFIMTELSQQRATFVEHLKKRAHFFPAMQSFIGQMAEEMQQGNIRTVPPLHLLLNLLGMTVFPFIAKPVFCTIFDYSDKGFEELMQERAAVILDFMKNALQT